MKNQKTKDPSPYLGGWVFWGIGFSRKLNVYYAEKEGAALTTVQSMLGHTNIRTTSIYLHPLESQKKETAQIMSSQFKEWRDGGDTE